MENTPISFSAPDFFTPEAYKNKEFYANMVRYYTNRGFNVPFYQFNRSRDNFDFSPIDAIIRNWSYYSGKQDISINSALLNGVAGDSMYRQGFETRMLVDVKVGKAWEFIKNSTITTEAINKEAKSRKQIRTQLILMFLNQREMFRQLEEVGIIVNPIPPHISIETQEDFEKQKEFTLKEFAEIVAERIANKNWAYNDCETLYTEFVRQCVVAGLAGIDNCVEDGVLRKEIVNGHQLIWDNANTDVYCSNSRYVGRVYYRLTPDEILAKWGDQLDEDEIAEIKKMNTNMSTFLEQYNTPINGQNLWCYPTSDGAIQAGTAVKIYARGHRDMRLMETEKGIIKMTDRDKNGKVIKKLAENKGDYDDEAIYEATLIMNKYVVDFGLAKNVTYDKLTQKIPQFPLQIAIPSITLDQYISDVGRITGMQDQIDYYANKITEICLKDLGRVHYINGKALGIEEPVEFMKNIRANNIHITQTDGETGEDLNPLSYTYVDMTLDPNVTKYVELKREMIREMREILSMPDVALGLQGSTIGKGVQQATISAANTGLVAFYNTVLNFMQKDLEVGVNMNKLSFASDDIDEETIEEVVGIDGLNFLKVSGMFPFEYYGVYIRLMDMISSEDRKAMLDEAFAALQSDPTLLPYLAKLRRMKSLREAENYLDYTFKMKERKQEEKEKAMMEQQAAIAAQANETQVVKSSQAAETERYSADKKSGATVAASENSRDAKKYSTDVQAEVDIIKATQERAKV
jgi:hypothetical protein